jgi:hypothetical protein
MERSLTDLLTEFLAGAGYSRKAGSPEMIFSAGKQSLQAFVFASVKSIDLEGTRQKMEDGRDCVILVPSMESPEPFVQFYKEMGRMAEEAGAAVWVANMEQGSIDPFIGYTTDMDIYTQFKNPRLAEIVRANWSKGL